MLSRAVASIFFEEHRPQKLPIHGLYAGVARDSCLPCKRYCRAVSRAAACRAPVALLVASRVNVPLMGPQSGYCPKLVTEGRHNMTAVFQQLRRQAITWSNDGAVPWRIYASPSLNDLYLFITRTSDNTSLNGQFSTYYVSDHTFSVCQWYRNATHHNENCNVWETQTKWHRKSGTRCVITMTS